MEAVGDAEGRNTTYDMVHHIARARHDKAHVGHTFEHLGSSLNEVVGALLEGDTSEEGYNLIVHTTLRQRLLLLGKAHGIVHGNNLLGRHAVAVDDDIAR